MGPMRKQRYSIKLLEEENLGPQQRYVFRKGKSAFEGDFKKS